MPVEQQGSYLSAFLSYTWDDGRFVHAIADELGRTGLLPWIDVSRMRGGDRIHDTVSKAIRAQRVFVLFLSPRTRGKRWLEAEIVEALRSVPERIVPVCLDGRAEELYPQHDALREWLSLREAPAVITGSTSSSSPKEIARKIALVAYERSDLATVNDVVLYFDQRGDGLRSGQPLDMPPDLLASAYPTLVFRSDRGPRNEVEVLDEAPWLEYQNGVIQSLKLALPNRRGRTFHVCGNAQLSLPWVFGRLVAGKDAVIKGYPIRELYQGAEPVDNSGWPVQQEIIRDTPTDYAANTLGNAHPLLPSSTISGSRAALLVGPQRYIPDANGYVAGALNQVPLFWLRTGDVLTGEDAKRVTTLVAQTLQQLKNRGVNEVHLLNCLPFHACPLVAKYACKVVSTLVYHEYRRDREDTGADPRDMYTPLSFSAADRPQEDERPNGAI